CKPPRSSRPSEDVMNRETTSSSTQLFRSSRRWSPLPFILSGVLLVAGNLGGGGTRRRPLSPPALLVSWGDRRTPGPQFFQAAAAPAAAPRDPGHDRDRARVSACPGGLAVTSPGPFRRPDLDRSRALDLPPGAAP